MGAGVSALSAAATLPVDYSIWDNHMSHSSDEEEAESSSDEEESETGSGEGERKSDSDEEERDGSSEEEEEEEESESSSEEEEAAGVSSFSSFWSNSEPPCACCFNRVLGTQGKLALGISSVKVFRRHLLQPLPNSIPLAAPYGQGVGRSLGGDTGDNAAGKGAKVRTGKRKGTAEMGATGGGGGYKCERAPHLCAEEMFLEWMAEPRVGVLMDLGRIRSRLPATITAAHAPAVAATNAATSSSSSALPSPTPPASIPWHCCWRCSSCWASYRHTVSLCAFLVLVANSPRFVTLWRAQLASLESLFAAIGKELGAHRQEEEDCLATVLVQVLGVKRGEKMKDGFKAHVLPLLPGGAEAHRESEGGAGEDRGKGGIADDGRKGRNGGKREAGRKGGRGEGKGDGGAFSSGEWRRGLEGPVWDRYVGGMACLLAHEGRDGTRVPKAVSSSSSDPNGSLNSRISKAFISSGIPKGMFVSGIDATGFALAIATILSKPQFSEDACRMFFTDANNEYRVKLENSAAEAARKKVGMAAEREKEGGDGKSSGAEIGVRDTVKGDWEVVTTTSNTVVAVLTWRVSCILMWVRTYGPNLQSPKACALRTCVKPKEDLPVLRHPFLDLPSMLIKSGTVPEPLVRQGFSWEWGEWPAGNEAAIKLADDMQGRIEYKKILEEKYGVTVDWEIPPRGRTAAAALPAAASAAVASKSRPVIRTLADVEFLLELTAADREPSKCTRCLKCHFKHAMAINRVALLASFAYRPISTLIHRFLFLFPPDQTREAYMLLGLFMPSGQEETVNWRHVRGWLEGLAEGNEVAMLTHACTIIAGRWANAEEPNPARFARLIEDEGAGQEKGGVGKWKQLDSEIWEEVRMWRHAAKVAWPGERRNWMGELRGKCMGRRKRTKRGCSEDEEEREEEEEEEGSVYAQKWVGGVNLLACLRAMLLGEPWKGCLSNAAAAAADLEKGGSAGKMKAAKRAAGKKAGGREAGSEEPGTPACAFWTDASGVDTRAERLKSGYRRVCQGPRCSCVEWDGVELKMCRQCGSEAYCSKACQKAAWPSHKLTCGRKRAGKEEA